MFGSTKIIIEGNTKKYSSFWFGGLYSPITNHFQVRNVISRKIISKLESISSVVSSLCKVYFHTCKIIDLHQNCFCLCDMFYIHLLRTASSENCDQFSSQQGRLIRRNDFSECFYYKVFMTSIYSIISIEIRLVTHFSGYEIITLQ